MANIKKSFNFRNGFQVDDDNFIVNQNGNIGIGTLSPLETVDIVGNIKVSGLVTTSSLSVGNVYISSGIVTSISGILTYYGDGSKLSGVNVSGYSEIAGISTYSTSSGISTYSTSSGISTYSTSSGIATYSTTSGISTYSTSSGISTYSTTSGISTYSTSSGITTYATSSGISTYATKSGIATYSTNSGISTNVIGGIASISQIAVTGISTFLNGPVLIGTASSTGTINQNLQITGNSYISGNLGVGTTNPSTKLYVDGTVTATTFVGDGTGLTNLTGVGTGVGVQSNTTPVGTATTLNFGSGLTISSVSGGVITVNSTGSGGESYWVSTNSGIHTLSNVGIGTTNPTTKLQVSGTVKADRFESSSSGVPTIDSPNNINLNAVTVAISTDLTVNGNAYLGISTTTGLILTAQNGSKYRLFVSNSGVLSTVLVP